MKKARGFTLVEIVIVVAIIGLLMVVLVPSITSAWKTNNMKAARLQAERVAKSIKVGILSGDIKTSDTAKKYTTQKVDINPMLNCVNNIKGIDTLFDLPDTNEDLEDPTSDDEDDDIFRIAYDVDNKKIIIFRAEATVGGTIEDNAEWQLYYEQ